MKKLGLLSALMALMACRDASTGDDAPGDDDLETARGLVACEDAGDGTVADADGAVADGGAPRDAGVSRDAGSANDAGAPRDAGAGGDACSSLPTQQARVACAANAVLATLSSTQRSGINLQLTDDTNRSKWNNLPVGLRPRAGLQLGSLSASSQAAVLAMMNVALNDDGRATMTGILRADDYLKTMQSGYGSETYSVAIYGTPSASSDFEVMFGGHHMAYNLNFVGGSFYPVPQHLASEPRGEFTFDGGTYAPMVPKIDAMFAVYESLDVAQRSGAYLAGQTFSDVVVNPNLDYGRGKSRTTKAAYPTGANRKGVLVSTMKPAQQALVTAALEQWVRQYPAEVADQLMSDYTVAYGDTYFAWGGSASGASQNTTGSYLRIDGPRAWVEVSIQGGIVIRGTPHPHTIYHDKTYDYGGQL